MRRITGRRCEGIKCWWWRGWGKMEDIRQLQGGRVAQISNHQPVSLIHFNFIMQMCRWFYTEFHPHSGASSRTNKWLSGRQLACTPVRGRSQTHHHPIRQGFLFLREQRHQIVCSNSGATPSPDYCHPRTTKSLRQNRSEPWRGQYDVAQQHHVLRSSSKFRLQAKRGESEIRMLGRAESASFRLICGLDCWPVAVSDVAVSIARTPSRAVSYFPSLFHGRRSSSGCSSSVASVLAQSFDPRTLCLARLEQLNRNIAHSVIIFNHNQGVSGKLTKNRVFAQNKKLSRGASASYTADGGRSDEWWEWHGARCTQKHQSRVIKHKIKREEGVFSQTEDIKEIFIFLGLLG